MHRPVATALALLLATGCQSTPPDAQPGGMPSGDMKVVYLRHAAASDVVGTMQQMGLPAQLTATAHAASNSIALQGEPKVVDQAITMITAIDKPAR